MFTQICNTSTLDNIFMSIFASPHKCSPSIVISCIHFNFWVWTVQEQFDNISTSIFASPTLMQSVPGHFLHSTQCNFSDTHVDSAVEYTTRATNDTKKALEYQSKARRKKIMMMLCMIVAGSLGSYIGLKYLGFV